MCPAISYPWPRLVIWRLFCQQYMMQERIVYLYYKHILGPAVSRAEHMQVNIHRRQAPHVSRRSRTIATNFTKVSYQLPRLDDVTHCALGIRSQNRSPSGHQILSMIDSLCRRQASLERWCNKVLTPTVFANANRHGRAL